MSYDISEWFKLAAKLSQKREAQDLSLLFDSSIVNEFEAKEKTLSEFVSMYQDFCQSFEGSAKLEAVRGRVADSMYELTKVLGLLDYGFEIISSSIDLDRHTIIKAESYYTVAEQIVNHKRRAIYRLRSLIEQEKSFLATSEEYAGIGLEILRIVTEGDRRLEVNYIERVEELINNTDNKLVSEMQIMNILMGIFRKNNLAFESETYSEWESDILNKIGNIIPESSPMLIETSYPEDKKEIVEYKIELFDTKLTLSKNFSDGPREFMRSINPVIKKNTGLEFLKVGSIINHSYILLNENQLREISENEEYLKFLSV